MVHPMTADDWPRVAEIYRQGIATNLATFQSECPAYEEWDRAHRQNCRLVLTQGGKIVGWAALSPISARACYSGVAEVSIYLDEEQRGGGLGTMLLRALAATAEEQGCWMLQSGIMRGNSASIRLHEKCGFRMVGYRERIARDRFECWRDTVLMERRSGEG